MEKCINIILDLDNTLISAIDEKEEKKLGKRLLSRKNKFTWINMDTSYKIFARPYLQEFLSWIFKHFNVSVWTAASKPYALFVIDNFILAGKKDRMLDYILFSNHCNESNLVYNTSKSLKMLSFEFPLDYDMVNTYIIDDHPEVYAFQPHNCIKIKPFNVMRLSCETDEQLLKVWEKLNIIKTNATISKCR